MPCCTVELFHSGNAGQREPFERCFRQYFQGMGIELTEEQYGQLFPAIYQVADPEISPLLLLRDGDDLIGFCQYQTDSPESDWNLRPGWGFIREFYICPDRRGRGFGRTLAAAAVSRMGGLSSRPGIYLTAEPDAVGFWSRCGFYGTGVICEKNEQEIFEYGK